MRSAKQSFAGIIIGNQIRSDQKFMGVFDEFLKERQEAEKNAEPAGGDWLDIFYHLCLTKNNLPISKKRSIKSQDLILNKI